MGEELSVKVKGGICELERLVGKCFNMIAHFRKECDN
jgi:hypothetical protein